MIKNKLILFFIKLYTQFILFTIRYHAGIVISTILLLNVIMNHTLLDNCECTRQDELQEYANLRILMKQCDFIIVPKSIYKFDPEGCISVHYSYSYHIPRQSEWGIYDRTYLDSFISFKEHYGWEYTIREKNFSEALSTLYDSSKDLNKYQMPGYLLDGTINPIVDNNMKQYVLELMNTMPQEDFISFVEDFNTIMSGEDLHFPWDNFNENILVPIFYSKLIESFDEYIASQT